MKREGVEGAGEDEREASRRVLLPDVVSRSLVVAVEAVEHRLGLLRRRPRSSRCGEPLLRIHLVELCADMLNNQSNRDLKM